MKKKIRWIKIRKIDKCIYNITNVHITCICKHAQTNIKFIKTGLKQGSPTMYMIIKKILNSVI